MLIGSPSWVWKLKMGCSQGCPAHCAQYRAAPATALWSRQRLLIRHVRRPCPHGHGVQARSHENGLDSYNIDSLNLGKNRINFCFGHQLSLWRIFFGWLVRSNVCGLFARRNTEVIELSKFYEREGNRSSRLRKLV